MRHLAAPWQMDLREHAADAAPPYFSIVGIGTATSWPLLDSDARAV
jgi:hypothetical protein